MDPIILPDPNRTPRAALFFTDDARTKILFFLKEGQSRPNACALARVRYKTFCGWLERGLREWEDYEDYDVDPTHPEYMRFAQDVLFCEAQHDRDFAKQMEDAFKEDTKNWVAIMTLNERRHPEKYGRKQSIAVQQDTTMRIIVEEVSGDDWLNGNRQSVIETTSTPAALPHGTDDL